MCRQRRMGSGLDCRWILALRAAYCVHPVRFGVVESVITTIKRSFGDSEACGNEELLLLKLE